MAEVTVSKTVDEAIENAGTSVTAFLVPKLKSRATEAEVEQYEKENQPPDDVLRSGEGGGGYVGPYVDPEDERNTWTADRASEPEAPPITRKGSKADERAKAEERKSDERKSSSIYPPHGD